MKAWFESIMFGKEEGSDEVREEHELDIEGEPRNEDIQIEIQSDT